LQKLGEDVRILIPGYRQVLEKLLNLRAVAKLEHLPIIGAATLVMGEMPGTGVPVLAVVNSPLYERAGDPYHDVQGRNWADNPLRFGILSQVAALLSTQASPLPGWIPDITHCNDWQSGLAAAYMHYSGVPHAKSVLGIHNLAFQGSFPAEWVHLLGLPVESYSVHGLEYYGQMSFLKGGVYYSDSITTVSQTYAQEIQTPEFGCGMQGLLSTRSRDIHGILNGIETAEWNPATDPHLTKNYNAANLAGKKAVKKALQQQMNLSADAKSPLLGVVSRLTSQKGLDLLLHCAEDLLDDGAQIVVLGGGEPSLEMGFRNLALRYPGRASTTIGYNEPLSHQIMAGADIFIMPSRFEPCGLNQMYGLAYGTPPVVRRTGGLADSVHDTNPASLKDGSATGFVFQEASVSALLSSIRRAVACYHDSRTWHGIQRNGMRRDLGWSQSASAYAEVYRSLGNV
jgi:starch synthase